MATDTFRQPKRVQKTVWWMNQEVARSIGEIAAIDPNTTVNHKYGFLDGIVVPNTQPSIQYFGVGIKGYYNTDDEQAWNVFEIPSDSMTLYNSLPLRVVPLVNDLTSTERSQYRGRYTFDVDGTTYVAYMYKKLSRLSGVTMTIKDPITGIEQPWSPDYSKLNPVPVIPPSTGVVTGSSTDLNVTATLQARVLGTEIAEVISVLYDGNGMIRISEWGFFSGVDTTATATDHTNTPFTYTEAAMMQLAIGVTTGGATPEDSNGELVRTLRIGVSDIALI